MTSLERKIFNYMQQGNDCLFVMTAQEAFPTESKTALRAALDSLADQGMVRKKKVFQDYAYELPDDGWGLADDAVPLSDVFDFNKPLAKEISPWPEDHDVECDPIDQCKFSKPHPTRKEVQHFYDTLFTHLELAQTIKQVAIENKSQMMQEAASVGLIDLAGVKKALQGELRIIADFRSQYFEKAERVLKRGLLSDIADGQLRDEIYRGLVSLLDDHTVEDVRINGSEMITVNVPNIASYRRSFKAAYEAGVRANMTSEELEAKKRAEEAERQKKQKEEEKKKATEEVAKREKEKLDQESERYRKISGDCRTAEKRYEEELEKQLQKDIENFTADCMKAMEQERNEVSKLLSTAKGSRKKTLQAQLDAWNAAIEQKENYAPIKENKEKMEQRKDVLLKQYKDELAMHLKNRFTSQKVVLGRGREPLREKKRSVSELSYEENMIYGLVGTTWYTTETLVQAFSGSFDRFTTIRTLNRLTSWGLLDSYDGKYALAGTEHDIVGNRWTENEKMKKEPIPVAPQIASFYDADMKESLATDLAPALLPPEKSRATGLIWRSLLFLLSIGVTVWGFTLKGYKNAGLSAGLKVGGILYGIMILLNIIAYIDKNRQKK